jgi:hypothetical protein
MPAGSGSCSTAPDHERPSAFDLAHFRAADRAGDHRHRHCNGGDGCADKQRKPPHGRCLCQRKRDRDRAACARAARTAQCRRQSAGRGERPAVCDRPAAVRGRATARARRDYRRSGGGQRHRAGDRSGARGSNPAAGGHGLCSHPCRPAGTAPRRPFYQRRPISRGGHQGQVARRRGSARAVAAGAAAKAAGAARGREWPTGDGQGAG